MKKRHQNYVLSTNYSFSVGLQAATQNHPSYFGCIRKSPKIAWVILDSMLLHSIECILFLGGSSMRF